MDSTDPSTSLKPYTTTSSIFLISFPALSALDNLPKSLSPLPSPEPTPTPSIKTSTQTSTSVNVSNNKVQKSERAPGGGGGGIFRGPVRRLTKRMPPTSSSNTGGGTRPRLPSTDTQGTTLSLPLSLSSLLSTSSTSSTSSRARRVITRFRTRIVGKVASLSRSHRRGTGGVLKRNGPSMKRKASTLDFRCCGVGLDEDPAALRKKRSRLEFAILKANWEWDGNGPPFLNWQKPNIGLGGDWFAGITA